MQLVEIQGKSKKTGKEYTAYAVKIGEYQTKTSNREIHSKLRFID